ncbi:MAG TPA: adenylate/guanylate cyclase domain-containing protein [Candidatus Paceibacterota bacterium]|nr:adenylate/guanylate cyclase domain-containing protein [Verrucomicrobiota bacterium]HRZ47468.1 adenylate/guanylate cyclase domain-containing protein [Candidatus Paceibacterota bacterium]HRZ92397.1 adenylate/guanylate cyclase domain-containing protein [Candidatus Paceibacterota bacterium]
MNGQRPAFTFRAKLILVMLAIVVGVAGATLYVAQNKFQEAHQQVFETQFATQIEFFSELQQQRYGWVSARCEELARDDRLADALRRGDVGGVGPLVMGQLFELGSLARGRNRPAKEGGPPGSGGMPGDGRGPARFGQGPLEATGPGGAPGQGPGRPAGPQGTRPEAPPFIRLVDAKGRVLASREPRTGEYRFFPPDPAVPAEVLSWFEELPAGEMLKAQTVGYLSVSMPQSPRPQVREVFITPVRDAGSGESLGALVLGLPLPDLGEQIIFELSRRGQGGEILSGLWLEGHLFSGTVPEDHLDAVAGAVTDQLRRSSDPRGQFVHVVNGVRHRVLYRVLNPDSKLPKACQVNLYSLAAMERGMSDLRWKIAVSTGVAMLGAVALVLLISYGLSAPIRDLVAGIERIHRGDFNVRLKIRSRDEFGWLTGAFNSMAQGLALNERYLNLLNRLVDRGVTEQLVATGAELGGEVREATVLFCDIRNFTLLTQKRAPGEVLQLLNEHMTALTAAVFEHGGVVDKFMGDQIMALFGAPKRRGGEPEQAVRCAWRMLEERRRLNDGVHAPWEVGIGIATGAVLAGCVGSIDRLNYTVLGDRVNLAARLCDAAQPGEILVDAATRDQAGPAIQYELRTGLRLKGMPDTVSAYRVAGCGPGGPSGALPESA